MAKPSSRNRTSGATRQSVSAQPPRVDVEELHAVHARGTLLAFASIQIGRQLTVRDLRLVEQDGVLAVLMPMKVWVDRAGMTRHRPLVVLPSNWTSPVSEAVIAAWRSREKSTTPPDHLEGEARV